MFTPSKTRVLVVGDVMLDEVWRTKVDRISPEAPVPVARITGKEKTLGGAANTALNCSKLFDEVTLIGVIGNDMDGDSVRHLCSENNIDFVPIVSGTAPTTNKTRILGNNQQIVRVDDEAICPICDSNSVLDIFSSIACEFGLVIFSDYSKGTLYQCQKMIAHCAELGIPTFVDPKEIDFVRYAQCDFIKPNLKEFHAMCDFEGLNDIESKMATDMLHKFSIKNLILTKGSQGISYYDENSNHNHFDATAIDVFDVTGAGDTVISVFAYAISIGLNINESLRIASLAAGYVVSIVGTASITLNILNNIDDGPRSNKKKLLSYDQLLEIRNIATINKKKIVMTNGCFDILHPGHMHYLKECSLRGDFLIILLNSDSSVAKLKGPKRPINNQNFRAAMLCFLDFVDYVHIFNEVTPAKVYKSITPDILVKGGDYIATDLVGYKEVTESGGSVEIIDFVEGFSTTKSINKILERLQ